MASIDHADRPNSTTRGDPMSLTDSGERYDAVELAERVQARFYRAGEIEVIARLILRDSPVRLQPGEWWAYSPERNLLVYPAHLLASWPGARAIGALCHEIAEALFAGPDAAAALTHFIDWGRRDGLEPSTSLLLLNVVNDFRVNRQYLALYPGSARFFRVLYTDGPDLHPKDDLRPTHGHLPSRPLAHHRFLDALIRIWTGETWPDLKVAPSSDGLIVDAVRRAWPAVMAAAATDSLASCAESVRRGLLPLYTTLVERSRRELAEVRDEDDNREFEPPARSDDEDEEPDYPGGPSQARADASVGGPAGDESGVFFFVREEATEKVEEPEQSLAEETKPKDSSNGQTPPPLPPRVVVPTGERWSGGVIHRMRRFRIRPGIDYDNFDYIAAVHRLEPLIHATVHGRDGALGLAHILNLRRFGTTDPYRRPRRFRRGDTGEIDEDHPERLLVDPAMAFLKGTRQQRPDSLKDFANAIMLDISGSIVQVGYPSKKFDQLVDTAVLFLEIHERLKLPYEMICFSDESWVVRSFQDSRYDNIHIDPSSAYVVKDFSYLIREMYNLNHGETQEAPALRRAMTDVGTERGLKTILMVTDGISSDRPALVDVLTTIQERNELVSPSEQLAVLAFGLGLAEGEFKASYEPLIDGAPIACSRGTLVPRIDALPDIVCRAIERRILSEGRLDVA
jgi:hypothetical protein